MLVRREGLILSVARMGETGRDSLSAVDSLSGPRNE